MSKILADDKPSLDSLTHHGVLGMKWGHRKKASTGDIHAARRKMNTYQTAHNAADRQRSGTKKGSTERKRLDATINRIKKDHKEDPQRVIAARMTRGEKTAALIVAGPFGLIPIAASSAVSRHIEKKQDDEAHNKK